MQRTIAGCDLDDTSLACLDRPPLHISHTLVPARVCCTTNTHDTNHTVGVVQLGTEEAQLIQQSFPSWNRNSTKRQVNRLPM